MIHFLDTVMLIGLGVLSYYSVKAISALNESRHEQERSFRAMTRELERVLKRFADASGHPAVEATSKPAATPPQAETPPAAARPHPTGPAPVPPQQPTSPEAAVLTPMEFEPDEPVSLPPVPTERAPLHEHEPAQGRPGEPISPARHKVPDTSAPLAPRKFPYPPRAPREPSQFELAAKQTLRQIWNWIIVGEEHVPQGVSMEYAMASQWLLRIGIIIVVIGIAFFLKYSIDRGLITPVGRVLITTAIGLGMLVGGTRLLGRKYHVLGQGLLGGGLATLYFAVYSAHGMLGLIESLPAFVLMGLITVLAGGIAVRFNSMLVAVLGIMGGYATPVLLSTGVVNFPGLFGYVLILGVGVLAICFWKNWPLVNYLSFFATYGLFFASMLDYDRSYFGQVFPFLAAFFVLFSTMTFLYKVVRGAHSNLLDLLALLLNAGVFFTVSFLMIDELYGRRWIAALSLSLTAFYIVHVALFLRRKIVDRALLVSFLGLAAFFLAVTMPLILSREWITASWAIQAVVLLWIAQKLGSEFVRQMSYLLFGIVLIRFGAFDLYRNFRISPDAEMQPAYLPGLLERIVAFGVPIASFGVAHWMLSRQAAADAAAQRAIGPENDTPELIERGVAFQAVMVLGFVMLLSYLHLEVNRTVGELYPAARLPSLTILWIGFCVYLLLSYLRRPSEVVGQVLVVTVAGVMIKLFLFDVRSWDISQGALYAGNYSFHDAALRTIDFAAVIGFLTVAWIAISGARKTDQLRPIFGFAALGLLFAYSTLEVNTFLHSYIPGLQAGGVSILWSIFALSLILRGIAKNLVILRYLGLGLFAIVSAKVLFSDLDTLDQFYRIVAFVLLGVLLLAGSFVYLRYREKFVVETKPAPDEPK